MEQLQLKNIEQNSTSEAGEKSVSDTENLSADEHSASFTSKENSAVENAAAMTALPFTPPTGYRELIPIGHGAQATVFKALDVSGNPVAIKCFDKQSFASWKDEELLRREVDTLRELSCSGIPKYIDFVEEARFAFLIESYVNAPSLAQRIEQGFRPQLDDVICILRNSAYILKKLSERLNPIIHRDIKPANILVDDDMKVSIVDFGVVAAIRQHTMGMTFAGTAGYLAPEQLYGKVTPAADIFGLGMSIVHLVTGVAPCDMEMEGLSPNIEKYMPLQVADALVVLLGDMIEPDPTHRIQNADELLDRIDKIDLAAKIVRKQKEKIKKLSEEKRIALRERARKRKEKQLRELALRIVGPKVKVRKDAFKKIRNIVHKRVIKYMDIYHIALTNGLIQLGIMAFVLIGACLCDLTLSSILNTWSPVFKTHIGDFATLASVLSCCILVVLSHSCNRGLIKRDDNCSYLKQMRGRFHTLNDIYRFSLTGENSDLEDLCCLELLANLHWEMSSKKVLNFQECEENNDADDEKTSELKKQTADAAEKKELDNACLTSDEKTELIQNSSKSEEVIEFPPSESPKSEEVIEFPPSESSKSEEVLEDELAQEEFCIVCPPKPVNIRKLLFSGWPLAVVFVCVLGIAQWEYEYIWEGDLLMLLGYFSINFVALLLPVFIYLYYWKTRGSGSVQYQKKFDDFYVRFLRKCRDAKPATFHDNELK